MPLVIIGEGEKFKELEERAGKNISFLGRQPDGVVTEKLKACKALVFPGVEDFGIVPVEAMSCGKPVIAFKRGGALDTVLEGETGVFFEEQSVDSLMDAVKKFERVANTFDQHRIRTHAEKFDKKCFKEKFLTAISSLDF